MTPVFLTRAVIAAVVVTAILSLVVLVLIAVIWRKKRNKGVLKFVACIVQSL